MEIKIKINEIEMTIEEAKDLHKELNKLFGSSLVNLPATNIKATWDFNKPKGYVDPRDLLTMFRVD